MAKIHHTAHAIQGDETLVDLFSLPQEAAPAAEPVRKKKPKGAKGKRPPGIPSKKS